MSQYKEEKFKKQLNDFSSETVMSAVFMAGDFLFFSRDPISFLAGWAMHGETIHSSSFPSVALKNSHKKLDTEETLDCF